MTLLRLESVHLGRILAGVSLTLDEGETLALVGPSGSGKSSLLRVVAGLVAPSRGCVRMGGVETNRDGRVLVPPEQRGLAMVFQDLALWPHLTVRENLTFGLRARGMNSGEADARAQAMLARVALGGAELRSPMSLSGGERQRVALARALVVEPRLLLFDEALNGLDVHLKVEMLALLRDLRQEQEFAMLLVTHDPGEAQQLARRVAVMENGRLVQEGSPEELARAPATPFVKTFVGTMCQS
jgi:ABC-type Fe3+/spermidine/putrescine transport system ATPase subunit